MKISELFVYPIKSCGGVKVDYLKINQDGPMLDRQWMLVDNSGQFLTQRELPELSLIKIKLLGPADSLSSFGVMEPSGSEIEVPLKATGNEIIVQVWNDQCEAKEVNPDVSEWFSQILNKKVYLVHSITPRLTDFQYGKPVSFNFADGFPFLIISQGSLDQLNEKLKSKNSPELIMNRFRPNIVIDGVTPHFEDELESFVFGDVQFKAVKPCTRCVITCTDQNSSERGKEPLRTLSEYRRNSKGKIEFGQNLIHYNTGTVRIGDVLIEL